MAKIDKDCLREKATAYEWIFSKNETNIDITIVSGVESDVNFVRDSKENFINLRNKIKRK